MVTSRVVVYSFVNDVLFVAKKPDLKDQNPLVLHFVPLNHVALAPYRPLLLSVRNSNQIP